MPRCLIITAYIEGNLSEITAGEPYDYVICADGGYLYAEKAGIRPDLIIGDFDSAKYPCNNEKNVISVPVEKDDTDTMLCVKKAIEMGYDKLLIAGGIGGRLDHTISNIQTLAFTACRNVRAVLQDSMNEVRMLLPGVHTIPKFGGKLSVFSYSGEIRSLTLRGVRYPLENSSLDQFFPLGVSNEITDETAEISFSDGMLLLILSKEV